MKVGVFLGNIIPAEGGGYTFQNDVYRALARLAHESQHQYVVFAHHFRDFEPNLSHLFYSDENKRPPLSERIRYRLGRYLPPITPRPVYERVLKNAVGELGLEFIWFASPRFVPVDIPYLAIVWDLQHRLQPWFPEVSNNGQWEHRENFYSRSLQRASAIITGTEAGLAEIVRFYGVPPERIKLLPHPTPSFALAAENDNEGEAAVLTQLGLAPGYLLYPARFWAHKNHAGLLYAMRHLRDQHGLILPIVLVGSDGGNQPYIEQLIEHLDLQAQVRLLGFVSRAELVALYRGALALVYPTFFGPENLPPLEAFALGCPVIASRVSGAEEQLGDAALLVEPTDHEGLAEAIRSVFESETLRKTLIERGRQRATRWTGTDFVRGVFTILDEFERIRRCWE